MSIRVMTLVWDNFPGNGSELLTMLAMADWCNDAGGSLHPSMATVASKIRLSEKQARRIVHGLIEQGYLSVTGNHAGGDPGMARQYRVNLEKLATPPASVTPPMDVTPPAGVRDPSHGCPSTPPAHGSLTVIEPPKEPPKAKAPAEARVCWVTILANHGVSKQVATDYLAVRKAKRSPMTQTALDGLVREANKAGYSLNAALSECCARSWTGFKADWVNKPRPTQQRFGGLENIQRLASQADPFAALSNQEAIDGTANRVD